MQPETHLFADDGRIPNSPLKLVVYRAALPADAAAMQRAFAAQGWSNAWRNGIFDFHHFHSNAHEVLGIAGGRALVAFGGPGGRELALQAGDVVVIPAGVGHCNRGASPDLLVVGAYPGGGDYDLCHGDAAGHAAVQRRVAAVPLPARGPLAGLPWPWAED